MILLDEIEKAHPDVFNILLQVLDEGHLTDNYGRVIDFKNTVVIMTSNVGARDITKGKALGFTSGDDAQNFERMRGEGEGRAEERLQPGVPEPARRRRSSSTRSAASTSRRSSRSCSRTFGSAWPRKSSTLKLTDAATEFLVKHGYDEQYGARPLKRAIQKFIEDPLSEKILMGEFSRGDEIEVDVAPDGRPLDFRVLTSSTKA